VISDQSDWGSIAAAAVRANMLSPDVLDRAVSRNLLLRFRLGMFDPPDIVPYSHISKSVIDSKEHAALALQSARESLVLLKNDPAPPGSGYGKLLPLDLRRINSIAVIGPYADMIQFGAYSGTPANPSLTIYKALRAAVGERVQVSSVSVADDAGALRVAGTSDLVIFVCGLNGSIEKEGIDRTSLKMPDSQQLLLERVIKANPATIMLVEGGSPVGLQWAKEHVPAIFWIGYPGEQGGVAVAQTLLGENNPSGRLPMTFYRANDDLPALDDYDITKGRTYMYLAKPAPYVFGHGLSFTTFTYANLRVTPGSSGADGTLDVSVDVTNAGPMDGDEVVQLYVHEKDAKVKRPIKQLKGFARVTIPRGQTRQVKFSLPVAKLAFWDTATKKYAVDLGAYEIMVGASSEDIRARTDITVK
jgi:beta-glucosidase